MGAELRTKGLLFGSALVLSGVVVFWLRSSASGDSPAAGSKVRLEASAPRPSGQPVGLEMGSVERPASRGDEAAELPRGGTTQVPGTSQEATDGSLSPERLAAIEQQLDELAAAGFVVDGFNRSADGAALLGELLSSEGPGVELFVRLLGDESFDFIRKGRLFLEVADAHPEASSRSAAMIRSAALDMFDANRAAGLTGFSDQLGLLPLAVLHGGLPEEQLLASLLEEASTATLVDLAPALAHLDELSDPDRIIGALEKGPTGLVEASIDALAERRSPVVDQALLRAADAPEVAVERRGRFLRSLAATWPEEQLPGLLGGRPRATEDDLRVLAESLSAFASRPLTQPAARAAALELFDASLGSGSDMTAFAAALSLSRSELPVSASMFARVEALEARGLPDAAALLERLRQRLE